MANKADFNVGDFFGLSTIDEISRYGQNLSEREEKALALKNRQRQNLGLGVTLDSEGNDYRSEKYMEAVADKDESALAIAQAKLQRDEDKLKEDRTYKAKLLDEKRAYEKGKATTENKAKPTGGALKSYQGSEVLKRDMADTLKLYDALDNKKEDTAKPYTDVALSFLPDDVGRLIEQEAVYTDDEVKKVREKIAKIESDFSKIMAGLSVTGFEMSDRQKWSPFATSLDSGAREQRLQNLRENLDNEQDVFEELYPKFSLKDKASNEVEPDAVTLVMPEDKSQQSTADRIKQIRNKLKRK